MRQSYQCGVRINIFPTTIIVTMLFYIIVFKSFIAIANRSSFAVDIFEKVVSEKLNENVVFSPAIIYSSLILLFMGAGGDTEKEMRKALKLGDQEDVDIAIEGENFMINSFEKFQKIPGIEIQRTNRIYVNLSKKVTRRYSQLMHRFFPMQVQCMDFRTDTKLAHNMMNSNIEKDTKKKVQSFIPIDGLHKVRIYWANAIYFKAGWKHPFPKGNTHKSEFFKNHYEKFEINMMTMNITIPYADLPEYAATAIELPYQKCLSMVVFLPKTQDGLEETEMKIAGKDLENISTKLKPQFVQVFLPRFRIQFYVALRKLLKEMGLKETLTPNKANFSTVIDPPGWTHGWIDGRHEAVIEIDEIGTDGGGVKTMSRTNESEPVIFRADHPFMFAIVGPYSVYFAGHVTKF